MTAAAAVSPSADTRQVPDDTRLFAPGRGAACVGAVALITLLAFEALAVAAAMPAVATALNGLPLYALAFGGTVAASIPGMVWAGRWSDRRGALRPTAWGLALFGCGLLLAALAPTMPALVAGRVLQGLGGGLLGVVLYVGMGQVVPSALHPRLFSLFATAWVVPGLVGPTVAAWLVAHWGWRSVFFTALALLPLAAALLLPAYARLPARESPAAGSASNRPFWQLLPVGTWRAAPGLPSVVVLRGLLAAAFASAEAFLPLALTQDQGWSLLHAGWALSTGAVFWSLGSAVQARVQQPAQRQRLLATGLWLVSGGIAVVAGALQGSGGAGWAALVLAGWALAGAGVGLSFPMLSVLVLKLSPPAEQGRNASALQLADALASSATLALAGVLAAQALGHTAVMLMAATLAAAAAVLSPRTQGCEPG